MELFTGLAYLQKLIMDFLTMILYGIGIAMGYTEDFLCSGLLGIINELISISPYAVLTAYLFTGFISHFTFSIISNYIIISLEILFTFSILILSLFKKLKVERCLNAI